MPSDSLRRFGGYLRTRWASPRRIRFWLLVLVIAYTLLGFLALPWIIQYLAVSTVKEDYGRELRIEAVHTNPYTLTLQIDGLALDDTDSQQLLGWQRLFIDVAWSSVVDGVLTLETLQLDQPLIQEERFAEGGTRFSQLATAPPEETTEEEDTPAETEDGASSSPALRVNDLRVEGGVLRFTDNLQETATASEPSDRVSLALEDLSLSASDLSLQKDAPFPVRMQGQLAAGGMLDFDGSLQLSPAFALEGDARIDELALAQAEPYLQQLANVQLGGGTLNLNGQMHTNAQQPFAFKGSGGIKALSIRNPANEEPLIGWQSLQTEELNLRLAERQLETDPISVDGLFGRVVINEDRSTNFGQLMAEPQEDTEGEAAANDEESDDSKADPFGITIEGIELTNGALRFADNSLPLPFSTSIHTLGGEISTLSSTSAQPAQVALEGEVAEYGLARVDGTVHAWHPMRETSLKLMFRNLQIPEYSPYTVRFAGRKIAGGTMDLDLDYTVTDNQLDGENNLVLRDLKLGEKMESSNAMDLPLDLAIGLLKDSDGVIDLDLPVTGDVGSPEFDINQVIRQALGNALKSVVQSPFRFLASLVGAESEDLGQVEFPAGRSDLLPPQRERVAKLREALNQRPELVLELPGPFSQAFDGPALQRGKAIETLRQRLAEVGRDVAEPSLTAEANQEIVETMFTESYPDADLEAVRARFTEEQGESSDDSGFDALAYRNHLAEKVIAAQSVTDADLRALANARASAVREVLVGAGADNPIEADRVRLLDPSGIDPESEERIAMEVGVTAD